MGLFALAPLLEIEAAKSIERIIGNILFIYPAVYCKFSTIQVFLYEKRKYWPDVTIDIAAGPW